MADHVYHLLPLTPSVNHAIPLPLDRPGPSDLATEKAPVNRPRKSRDRPTSRIAAQESPFESASQLAPLLGFPATEFLAIHEKTLTVGAVCAIT